MHFTIEQLADLAVNAAPTLLFLAFLAAFIFGGELGNVIEVIASGWLFGQGA